MAIKKTELYSSLWASCDELRGGMDASQYKDYVLTFLFMKFVSDKAENDPRFLLDVPEGASFADMVKLKHDKKIGVKINKIIGKLAEANNLKNVIDVADFNDETKLGSGPEMVSTLSKLVAIFEGLELGRNRAENDDLLGDAYEYLMRHFATLSGKSKGQFYTPSEVSRILAKVVGIDNDCLPATTIYDPTCGSGSLLLKAADESPRGLSIYGQEKDVATTALCRMNMILHNNETATIAPGGHSTLSDPEWKDDDNLKTFDFAVANPPFSYKSWSNGVNTTDDLYHRFEYGIPPQKNGDYAFLLHIIKSLKSTGKAAVILPHGVLFRGNVEASIRRNLIRQKYIKGIIGLPANLFYGTTISACIIVIDKEHAQNRDHIFMIDASKGFIKDGNKNRLREQDIHKIVDVFNKQIIEERYSRLVELERIERNEYNLNLPRYIDSSDPEDIHDLDAHLNGGIPNTDIDALSSYWQVFPSLRLELFEVGDRDGYSNAKIEAQEVKATILKHDEFKIFADESLNIYQHWQDEHNQHLHDIAVGDDPKQLIFDLSEDLLSRFSKAPLLDKYDIFQILMDYWAEIMQDDVYILIQDGWEAGKTLRKLVPRKDDKGKTVYNEKHDFETGSRANKVRYKADLIPPSLMIAEYFQAEQDEINQLQTDVETASQYLETYIEEQSSVGDDGEDLLEDAKNEKGNVTKTNINKRIRELNGDETLADELTALEQCLKLIDIESKAKKKVKDKTTELNNKVFAHYPTLEEATIKKLVIEDKWKTTIKQSITTEIERVTQQLANRVKTLEERYAETLPNLISQTEDLSSKVDEHLKRMGLSW